MKKLLLATAVAALTATAANAAPTVYGKAFLTMDYVEDGRTQLNDNSSRIGLKGAEALSDDTSVVYQLEYGVDVTGEDGGVFKSRDTYLGLSSKTAGTVLAGRLTAIDDMVNFANVTSGMYDGILATIDAPRANNAVAYVTPDMNGFSLIGMYVMDENSGKANYTVELASNGTEVPVSDETYGIAAKYGNDMINAGASYIVAKIGKNDVKDLRVSGNVSATPELTLGALYQVVDFDTLASEKENSITVSAEYAIPQSAVTVYGQVDMIKDAGGSEGDDAEQYVLGGKYKLAKATTGHAYIGVDSDDHDDKFGVGFGVEHKF